MLYAIADKSKVIGVRHLKAALSMWEYCRLSAATLFGAAVVDAVAEAVAEPEPDPLWLRLLNAIEGQPGIARGELLRAVREPADAVGDALSALSEKGMAYCRQVPGAGAGRKAERWYPGDDADKPHNLLSPSPLLLVLVPDADADAEGKEGINSGDDADADGKDGKEGINSGDTSGAINSFLPIALVAEPEAAIGGINSFLPNAEAAPDTEKGEKEKVVVTLSDLRPWVNHFNATGITYSLTELGGRPLLVTRTPVGNGMLGEAQFLPDLPPKPSSEGVTDKYVCRYSDLRWVDGKVIGTNISLAEVQWVQANPRKAEAIAKRKSGVK